MELLSEPTPDLSPLVTVTVDLHSDVRYTANQSLTGVGFRDLAMTAPGVIRELGDRLAAELATRYPVR